VISAQKYLIISAASALILVACGKSDESAAEEAAPAPLSAVDDWAEASGEFISPDGENMGSIAFRNTPNGGVLIRADITGLAEGWHGMHLHQVADCSDGAAGFKASGGHIDPDEKEHGLLNPAGPERADLPNIYANASGHATAEIYADAVTLFSDGNNGSVALIDEDGFAVIVHENPDDHMTQPIGGAGARVACAALVGE